VRILISAGEASGEMYGAQLMEALHRLSSKRNSVPGLDSKSPPCRTNRDKGGATASEFHSQQLEFFGVGGEKMRAAGCDTVIDAKELAVVGITEILSHLPKIWGLFHKLIAETDKRKPDLAIVIDSPAFNWRVARQMKKRGIPVIYYVCPQFWAWRQGRVRLLRKHVDKALVIFPFEEKFYRDRGVDAEFVGHPLGDLPRPLVSREQYAAQCGLDPAKPWITIMPGSRVKEVRMNLPEILRTAALLSNVYEFLLPVAPTLDWSFVQQLIEGSTLFGNAPAHVGAGTLTRPAVLRTERIGEQGSPARTRASGPTCSSTIHLVQEALPALAHSRAGIIASGTATVEAALMETPFVMVYRVTPLTYLLGRSTVKVRHFAMVNLIAGREVVPELVQHNFNAERVVKEINRIVPDGEQREKMLNGLGKVRGMLRGNGASAEHPAERAARAVLRIAAEAQIPA
jgi:lipid-A-disaccharide synthase